MKSICVFCGSNSGKNPLFAKITKEFGKQIAERELSLVYGSGSTGLMGILADACLASGGTVTGIVPEHLNSPNMVHQRLQNLIVVSDMFERKSRMESLSDGFVVLPGGFGTIDELFEMITLCQLKRHDKPVIVFNIDGYFDNILRQVKTGVEEGFISFAHAKLLRVAKTTDHLFSLLEI
ncbi:TIGR00730 family Rossman fold protein [bacterium]|nr:TIGR00730 family Rossman fold protein [bacterium]